MKILRTLTAICLMTLALTAAGCSEADETPYFQNDVGSNNPEGDTKNPFDGLLNNGDPIIGEIGPDTLPDLFDPSGDLNLGQDTSQGQEDYEAFEDKIANIADVYPTQTEDVLRQFRSVADDYTNGEGIYGLMSSTNNIMKYLLYQDDYDTVTGTYETWLFSYMDRVDAADLGLRDEILTIALKLLGFVNARYVVPGTIEARIDSLRDLLADNSGQTLTSLLFDGQEAMGKLLLRADSNIHFTDPLGWNGTGNEDIELGNSVAGVDYLMTAVTDMVSTANTTDGDLARANLYGILEETGKLIKALQGASPYYTQLKSLLTNLENYFTTGGAAYNGNYNHPMAAEPNNYYVNAELRNAVKELWPGLAKLFIRERAGGALDPDYSIIYSGNHQRSPIEWLTRAMYKLKSAGIDYSDETNYAIEPTLQRVVQYNALGTVRSSNYKLSFLDHLMFTTAAGYTFGYKTRTVSGDNMDGEPYSNAPSGGSGNSYLHGKPTGGILTLNDTMYSLKTGGLNTVASALWCVDVLNTWSDSYSLALTKRIAIGQYTWRSGTTQFTYSDSKSNYEFYIGYDYPALALLTPGGAGDAGLPNGGQKAITPDTDTTGTDGSNNDYRTYFPKVADGGGDLNTGSWMFGWIARVCWDGAGPYYASAGALTLQKNEDMTALGYPEWPSSHAPVPASFSVYFKPNGEVYAYVDVSGNPYRYYYPVTGNDVADADSSAHGQRFNRYSDTCKSDYYMVQNGHVHGGSSVLGMINVAGNGQAYCVPPMNPTSGTTHAEATSGANKFRLKAGNFQSQRCQVYERVIEWNNNDQDDATEGDAQYYFVGNTKRVCPSQEIAMYRNFQWLLLEKKFMFVIPLNLYQQWNVVDGSAWLDSAAFIIIEANGLVGSTNAAKGGANGQWVSGKGEGVGADSVSHRNSPDYGNSVRPGDARILVLAKYFDALDTMSGLGKVFVTIDNGTVSPEVLFSTLLLNGHVMPDAVGANIGPVLRLSFMDQGGTYVPSTFDASTALWGTRNKLLPIFTALAGVLKDGTYYQASGSGYNYNYTGHHKYPLKELLENVMLPLSKPMMRVWDDGGSKYGKRWAPRINNESGTGEFDYFMPINTGSFDSAVDYYPGSGQNVAAASITPLRTLTSFLGDTSATTYGDGLISILNSSNNRMVTKLLALIQRLGNNDAGSVYKDVNVATPETLGILANFSQGLEQIVTSVQVNQGDMTTYGYGFLDDSRYHWIYSNGHGISRLTGTPAPISVSLDEALNELIGDNTKGLSKFVDDRESPVGSGTIDHAKWDNYEYALDAVGELIGDSASPYYILGNATTPNTLVHLVNTMLTGITTTPEDRQALRHTLGVLCNRYEGSAWTTNTELSDIMNVYLPEVLEAYDGHYANFIPVLIGLLDYDYDGTMEPDLIQYLGDLLIPVEGSENIMNFMYSLLNRDPMWDATYNHGGYLGRSTWKELADVFEDLADSI